MIKGLLELFKETKPDRSETDRLEQRIRDIRERIRRAKSLQESVFPPSRMDLQTAERLRKSSDELRKSPGEGSEIPQKPGNSEGKTESPAEELRRKLLSKSKT
jgi:hypothetical protein